MQTWSVLAVPVEIPTPGGTVTIDVSHAGPTGQLVEPGPPVDAGFQPPTIFTAPLPVGSGARALGQSGAFTAVADDATAASWNPAGLVQLELPELSAVYRFSVRDDRHASKSEDLVSGENRYFSSELNYLSAVTPIELGEGRAVVSINFQEVYDYTQEFSARYNGGAVQDVETLINQTFNSVTNMMYNDVEKSMLITVDVTTDTESRINQILNSSLLTGIDFQQSGTIDAISPAMAVELSPKFSLGMAVNFYADGAFRGNPIESTMVADYDGTSDSEAYIADVRNSTAEISWSGVYQEGDPDLSTPEPFSDSTTANFSDTATNTQEDQYLVDGRYQEDNRTEDFHGINATFGALWTLSRRMTVGATLDLPWTGKGNQTKTIKHQVTTFDSDGNEVAFDSLVDTKHADVEYTFPLYWSIGGLYRWKDNFYTSADVSCTHWSGFTYQAEGQEKINPLNGEPHSSSEADDCFSFRLGGEYLHALSWTELPLRGGLFWEQRPAAGTPDEYWGFSLGSGISLGKNPGKLVLSIAYIYEMGNNVMGTLLPDQSTTTDSTKHQLFVSGIWHF